jgi:thiol-disulfide isomerase/thioredoxin
MGVAAAALADASLAIGSKAPAVEVARWVKGTPVKQFEKGKVYVVEFWATWCGPCKVSIPHLTELAKKYAGKVTFTGVSVWEKNAPLGTYKNYGDKVDAFAKEWGDKMAYNVAWDGDNGSMAENWMKAAGQNGIPTAFVIDQTGTVAWIGHPMANLDEVLGQVLDGTYDMKAELARQDKARADEAARAEKMKPLSDALRAKNFPQAVAEMDKLFASDPEAEMMYGMTKLNALFQYNAASANKYAMELANGVYKDNANALNSMAWMMVDDAAPVKGADVKTAIKIAEMSISKTGANEQMALAYALDTLAFCYFKDGQVDKAIATQEKALKTANQVQGFDAATLKEMTDRMAQFKAAKKNG